MYPEQIHMLWNCYFPQVQFWQALKRKKKEKKTIQTSQPKNNYILMPHDHYQVQARAAAMWSVVYIWPVSAKERYSWAVSVQATLNCLAGEPKR